jgi:hypothetical protein
MMGGTQMRGVVPRLCRGLCGRWSATTMSTADIDIHGTAQRGGVKAWTTLAHAGGIDEMGIIVLPAVMGFGTWILTRRRNVAQTKPNYPAAQVNSSPTSPAAQPGWTQAIDRSSAWTGQVDLTPPGWPRAARSPGRHCSCRGHDLGCSRRGRPIRRRREKNGTATTGRPGWLTNCPLLVPAIPGRRR